MSSPHTRRAFLANAARAGALAGLGDFAFLRSLPPLSAGEVRDTRNVVRFSADIEPQARLLQATDWVMPAVDEARVPPAHQARRRFIEAMDNWDEAGADVAVASLVRNAGATEVIELFWRYGARDFRDIGHKAIFAANAWRTLQTIGWRHAEPVMRSLAYALLEHEGENPARRDADPDRPWRENVER